MSDLTWTDVYRIVGHADEDGLTDCATCGAATRQPFDHAGWHVGARPTSDVIPKRILLKLAETYAVQPHDTWTGDQIAAAIREAVRLAEIEAEAYRGRP